MLIDKSIYKKIIELIGASPVESGGIIGIKNGIICAFSFDCHTSEKEYVPRTGLLNAIIEKWANDGVTFAGIVHSHPNGLAKLSDGDKKYAEEILKNSPWIEKLFFPILIKTRGKTRLYSFEYDGEWKRGEIILKKGAA